MGIPGEQAKAENDAGMWKVSVRLRVKVVIGTTFLLGCSII